MQTKHSQEHMFLQYFEELSDPLFRHVYFRISDREVAKDIVQDVFMKTWNEIQKGNVIDNMKAFLYRVANNTVIDYYRKSKSSSLDVLLEDGYDPVGDDDSGILAFAELSIATEALQKLSPSDRAVLVMRHVDGMSPKEISEQIGESENVVSVRIHRATSRLKKITNYE